MKMYFPHSRMSSRNSVFPSQASDPDMTILSTMLHRLVPASALLLVLSLSSGCGPSPAESGETALKNGDYQTAVKMFRKAAQKEDKSPALQYNLGVACAKAGDNTGARLAFARALELDPGNVETSEYLARILRETGDLVHAREISEGLAAAAAEGEPFARALNDIALTDLACNRADLALLRLFHARRAVPAYAPTYFNLARIYFDRYQLFREAFLEYEAYLRLAVEGDPMHPKADEGIARLRALGADRDPQPPSSSPSSAVRRLISDGSAFYQKKQWQKAVDCFEKALKADAKSYDAAFSLAASLFAQNKLEEANAAYRKAEEIAPGRADAVFGQAQIAYVRGDQAEALQILSGTLIPKWPSDARSYELAAYAACSLGHLYEARQYGEAYIDLMTAAGNKPAAFAKWLAQIPVDTPFPDLR